MPICEGGGGFVGALYPARTEVMLSRRSLAAATGFPFTSAYSRLQFMVDVSGGKQKPTQVKRVVRQSNANQCDAAWPRSGN